MIANYRGVLNINRRVASRYVVGAIAVLMLLAGLSVHAKSSTEKVKKETSEAVEAAGEFAGEKKEEFAKRMKTNLNELDRQIEDLKMESATKSEEVKKATQKRIGELQKKRDDLSKKYEALEKSTDKAWTKMKTGFEKAWGEVRSAYSEAKTELSKSN